MRAMILAAGRGTRMGALTADRPKPLLDLAGESLIERNIRQLAAAGVDEIVVNLSYRGEQIRAALGDGHGLGVRLTYSQEPEEPLETAGGIVAALPLLGQDPFIVVNADVVTDFDFRGLVDASDCSTIVLVPNPPHHPQGDFGLDPQGRVTPVVPKLTYSGIARFEPELFVGLAPGRRPLVQVLDSAIAERRLCGVAYSGLWLDVGTPERLEVARAALASV